MNNEEVVKIFKEMLEMDCRCLVSNIKLDKKGEYKGCTISICEKCNKWKYLNKIFRREYDKNIENQIKQKQRKFVKSKDGEKKRLRK